MNSSIKTIGRVTPEEKDEIKYLYERKKGLTELFKSLAVLSSEELEKGSIYEKLVNDMGETTVKFQNW